MSMSAGEKLRIMMTRQKMSMGEMADKTGQSRQNLSNKMKRDDFSEKEIEKMAAALGCVSEVIFRDEEGKIII